MAYIFCINTSFSVAVANAGNNGFNTNLDSESLIILNGRPLTVANYEQAALRRGKSFFTGTFLKSP